MNEEKQNAKRGPTRNTKKDNKAGRREEQITTREENAATERKRRKETSVSPKSCPKEKQQ